jgi:hypothetical protein
MKFPKGITLFLIRSIAIDFRVLGHGYSSVISSKRAVLSNIKRIKKSFPHKPRQTHLHNFCPFIRVELGKVLFSVSLKLIIPSR